MVLDSKLVDDSHRPGSLQLRERQTASNPEIYVYGWYGIVEKASVDGRERTAFIDFCVAVGRVLTESGKVIVLPKH